MSDKINYELALALAEFTTFVIDKYDSDDPSARGQMLVKGVFAGASCGSLVEYANKQRSLAYKYISPMEVKAIIKRSQDGRRTR